MLKIREMRPEEFGLLDEFLYQTIFTAPGEPRPPRSIAAEPALRAYIEGFGRPDDTAVCAGENGAVVGAAWARLMRGYGFVDEMIPELAVSVLPEYRGRGIGTVLLAALIDRCDALGFPAISLSVRRANPAIHLYEKLGFREASGNDEEAVLMLSLGAKAGGVAAGVPFAMARAAAMRVLTAPALKGRVFLEGGLVPWVISAHDSGRLHGDVDVSVRLEDMLVVRTWLREERAYDAELDSFELACNEGLGDFGTHAVIGGVLVSFCPYYCAGGELRQRNAALILTDGFEALFEAVAPGIDEADFVGERALSDGSLIGCATLESVRAVKMASNREKDVHDVAEIDRIGYDPIRYARLSSAFAAMRIDCVAHGE